MQPTRTLPTGSRVNGALSRRRPERVVETIEYAAFVRRIIRAYSRRVADGDVDALPAMVRLASELDAEIGNAVDGLRRFGYSWADIGLRLGISRQAAQQRWGDR
ncbi:hypothetical protein [Actinocatenispora rupis]|uniref:Sigma-70, region 4 n=1 Tax=Actinocatenispora rupis TaxID=519421 RepID=A0A8J3J2N5_9ACTN|nr:hypothetical protein [Actinocatenispora rupis]GID13073.1 hypothetical protein Aru02nite_39620 [Actinocatenispora rupis]